MSFFTLRFQGTPFENFSVEFFNQLLLPTKEEVVATRSVEEVARAIETMVVRGAPAIGVSAAMGLALGAEKYVLQNATLNKAAFQREWDGMVERLRRTRPTAVNLFWALDRMNKFFAKEVLRDLPPRELVRHLVAEAQAIFDEDVAMCRSIGRFGAELMPNEGVILTHCNAGALCAAGYGTALGVIRAAVAEGKKIRVFCDETRPYLQGARLTAWELMKDGIDATVITDNMAGHFMKSGLIKAVVVGADRIARNGDAANKIGTYSLSVLCKHHNIPMYFAAPSSTFDLKTPTGESIPIEERSETEVKQIFGQFVVPPNVPARHPAFDVTPASHIAGIITERGVISPVTEANVCSMIR
jgi:methylthioribose-1-phosphate isomerase